jgi:endonuclease YncB( thermonuclease family)
MRILTCLFLSFHLAVTSAAALSGRVIGITDGDTIVILAEGNVQHKIRLQGIDHRNAVRLTAPSQSSILPTWSPGIRCLSTKLSRSLIMLP